MELHIDAARLTRLCEDLSALSGARVCVLGGDGETLCASGERAPFCARLNACAEGRGRCRSCELQTIGEGGGALFRRCHALVRGALLPIRCGEHAEPVAWLCAGQFLDDVPPEEQWAKAKAALSWFPGGAEALREDFLRLPTLSARERGALAGTLETTSDYIRLCALVRPARESDSQRLERFLDEHYMEKLTLSSISAQLHIGRTRLCALAKKFYGGETLFAIIARKRIDAAKALLTQTERPISAIAEAVGVSDYNYFSKIFRAAVGCSPSEYRKRMRSI